jgi:hypothetical protein
MVAVMFSVVVATASQVLFHSFPARWTLLLLLLQLLLLFTAAADASLVLSFEFLTVLVLRMRLTVDCDLTVSWFLDLYPDQDPGGQKLPTNIEKKLIKLIF